MEKQLDEDFKEILKGMKLSVSESEMIKGGDIICGTLGCKVCVTSCDANCIHCETTCTFCRISSCAGGSDA